MACSQGVTDLPLGRNTSGRWGYLHCLYSAVQGIAECMTKLGSRSSLRVTRLQNFQQGLGVPVRVHNALKSRPKSRPALRNTHNLLLINSDLAWPEAGETSHLCKISM